MKDNLSSLGFEGFSPYTLPNVIEVAAAVPLIALAGPGHLPFPRQVSP
jgi:hypothetical protein